MKDISSKVKGKTFPKKTAYVTKRILVRAAGSAGRKASQKAMETAGYLINAVDGWVVQVNKDGSTKQLSKLTTIAESTTIYLD